MVERCNASRGWDYNPEEVLSKTELSNNPAIPSEMCVCYESSCCNERLITMKSAAGIVFSTLLSMVMIGCGGSGSQNAPPPQTGGDGENAQQEDPNAGVACDQELMQKGMTK